MENWDRLNISKKREMKEPSVAFALSNLVITYFKNSLSSQKFLQSAATKRAHFVVTSSITVMCEQNKNFKLSKNMLDRPAVNHN